MNKSKIKNIFIGLGITLLLSYFGIMLTGITPKHDQEVCNRMEIFLSDSAKIQLISRSEIARILEMNRINPIGKSLKNIQTESIEGILGKNPMVKEVECFKMPSGAIRINIEQRNPKFRIAGAENYYVDTDRQTMPVASRYTAYVPIVSGRVTKKMATGELFDFITYIENDTFWGAQIEQIHVRNDQKIELVPRVGDGIIVLGTLDRFESKLKKLEKLYVKGFNKIGWNHYQTIDLQFKDQVVCTKK